MFRSCPIPIVDDGLSFLYAESDALVLGHRHRRMAGYSLSLGASLWANTDRKRRELSVLRLLGFRGGASLL